MAVLRLFAAARIAAGRSRDSVSGTTLDEVLDVASRRYGSDFADVLATSAVWVNGSPGSRGQVVADDDEIAVLPPVSGGLR
jgi:molybdopterin synthase sulfur carrier subunit